MPHMIKQKKEKLFTFLVVLMALLNVYVFPGIPVGFGEAALMLFFPFYYKSDFDLSVRDYEKGFVLWLAYTCLVTLCVLNYVGSPLNSLFATARVVFYWIIIFFIGKNLFDFKFFEKIIMYFSLFLSTFILVQLVVYTITGIYIPGYLLNVPLNDGDVTGLWMYEHSLQLASWKGFIRPSGFLCEPSHCCEFLFVSIMVLVASRNIHFVKKNLLIFVFAIAILATRSTEGVVLLFLSMMLYVIAEKRISFLRIPLIVLLVLICVGMLSGSIDTNNNAIERISNIINGSNNVDNSSDVRLNNGFNLFFDLPSIFKFFGCGMGQIDYLLENMSLLNTEKFMNAFSWILIMSGFLGTIIWFFSLFIFFVKANYLGKSLVVGFSLMSMGSSVFCQPQMVWIFLLIIASMKDRDDRCVGFKL